MEQNTNQLDIDLATPINELTFEKALSLLEIIVTTLEKGDVPLNRALEIYEKGEALKNHCSNLLKSVEAKVEKITINNNKTIIEDFDPLA
ncbi:exodeoxyribonuclease VII small subunit [Bartonella sp. DGB1]|uniref:exodeoxyribonuclease VII small subunit n=1 Tax=Bartonella sp. DGB1 TaxID=3239807 RepID=UPI00352373F6